MNNTRLITSEYVNYGHSNKVADQISDALLDAYLVNDCCTRANIKTMIKDNIVVVGGEVSSNEKIDIDDVIRSTIDSVGFPESHRLSGENVKVINLISNSSDKALNDVNEQTFVFGMASNETKVYIPLGAYIARQICNNINRINGVGPEVKAQICIEYGARRPKVKSIIVNAMHIENMGLDSVRELVKYAIINNQIDYVPIMNDEIFLEYIKDKDIEYCINVDGEQNIGGPNCNCGITSGSQFVVYTNADGCSFSGKDMSNVGRSASYMCRYIAKNIVNAGLADEAKVELNYIKTKLEPSDIKVVLTNPRETVIKDLSKQIEKYIKENIDLTVSGINCRFFPKGIEPIFFNVARNGQFGYNDMPYWYPWENTDLSDRLNEYIEDVEILLME